MLKDGAGRRRPLSSSKKRGGGGNPLATKTWEELEVIRQGLTAKRELMEQKDRLRCTTATEFADIHLRSLIKTKSTQEHHMEIARQRNEKLLKDAQRARAAAMSVIATTSPTVDRLHSAKERFFTEVEDLLPEWQTKMMATYASRLEDMQREQTEVEKRRQVAMEIFEKEQAVQEVLQKKRHELSLSQVLLKNEELERSIRRRKFEQEVQEVDRILLEKDLQAQLTTTNIAPEGLSSPGYDGEGWKAYVESSLQGLRATVPLQQQPPSPSSSSPTKQDYYSDLLHQATDIQHNRAEAERQKARWLSEQVSLNAAEAAQSSGSTSHNVSILNSLASSMGHITTTSGDPQHKQNAFDSKEHGSDNGTRFTSLPNPPPSSQSTTTNKTHKDDNMATLPPRPPQASSSPNESSSTYAQKDFKQPLHNRPVSPVPTTAKGPNNHNDDNEHSHHRYHHHDVKVESQTPMPVVEARDYKREAGRSHHSDGNNKDLERAGHQSHLKEEDDVKTTAAPPSITATSHHQHREERHREGMAPASVPTASPQPSNTPGEVNKAKTSTSSTIDARHKQVVEDPHKKSSPTSSTVRAPVKEAPEVAAIPIRVAKKGVVDMTAPQRLQLIQHLTDYLETSLTFPGPPRYGYPEKWLGKPTADAIQYESAAYQALTSGNTSTADIPSVSSSAVAAEVLLHILFCSSRDLVPLDLLNGLVDVDKVSKYHRRMGRSLDLWNVVVRHIGRLTANTDDDTKSYLQTSDVVGAFTDALLGDVTNHGADLPRFRRKIVSLLESMCSGGGGTTGRTPEASRSSRAHSTASNVSMTSLVGNEGVVMLGARPRSGTKKKINMSRTSSIGMSLGGMRLDELEDDLADLESIVGGGGSIAYSTTNRAHSRTPSQSSQGSLRDDDYVNSNM